MKHGKEVTEILSYGLNDIASYFISPEKDENKLGCAGPHSRFPLGFPLNSPSARHQRLNLY
jgi:hypothetical protein